MKNQSNDARYHVARPDSPGPGVILLHAWWGLVPDIVTMSQRLAEQGYLVVAPDLFDGRVADTPEEAEALVQAHPGTQMVPAVARVADWLRQQPDWAGGKVTLMGFSYGAGVAMLADEAGIGDAIVLFYGTAGPDSDARTQVPILGHFAEDDPYEPQTEVAQLFSRLQQGGVPVQFLTYPGTGHWFMEPSRQAYQPGAAAEAWDRTLDFLQRVNAPSARNG